MAVEADRSWIGRGTRAWLALGLGVWGLSLALTGAALVIGRAAFAGAPVLAYVAWDGPASSEVRLLDVDRGRSLVLAAMFSPAWSPAGDRLALVDVVNLREHQNEIHLFDLATRRSQPLAHNGFSDTTPAWSPDGEWIAYVSTRVDGRHLYLRSLTTGENGRAIDGFGEDNWPAWSPDGARLAFAASASGRWGIYVLDLAARTARLAARLNTFVCCPAWSPEGSRIAFLSGDAGGMSAIFVVELASGEITSLLDAHLKADTLAWSPDGWRLAFVSNAASGSDVIVLDLAGNTPGSGTLEGDTLRNVTAGSGGDATSPAWWP